MIAPSAFHDLASGRRRGVAAAVMRAALGAASVPYGWVVERRNRAFDRGERAAVRVGVPVISVGNLTTGGSGKTPLVVWIVRRLLDAQISPAILSRGYRAASHGSDGRNDEARELACQLPDVPHVQNPDRVAAAMEAIDALGVRALVLDDGFQHRRLARDLDVVLLDATEPFGFERLLPRGLLREPAAGLRRAGVVVLSRADMLDPAGRAAVRRRAASLCPHGAWCEVRHAPAALVDVHGLRRPVADAAGKRVAAFCGIGNPAGFRHTLENLGARIVAWREFPDHHPYGPADAAALAAAASAAHAELVLCTRKDLVKLDARRLGPAPLAAVSVEIKFLAGEAALRAALAPLVAAAR